MRLLCLDVGSHTQDILLLDTAERVPNAIQLVLPAPTVLVAHRIERATVARALTTPNPKTRYVADGNLHNGLRSWKVKASSKTPPTYCMKVAVRK